MSLRIVYCIISFLFGAMLLGFIAPLVVAAVGPFCDRWFTYVSFTIAEELDGAFTLTAL